MVRSPVKHQTAGITGFSRSDTSRTLVSAVIQGASLPGEAFLLWELPWPIPCAYGSRDEG